MHRSIAALPKYRRESRRARRPGRPANIAITCEKAISDISALADASEQLLRRLLLHQRLRRHDDERRAETEASMPTPVVAMRPNTAVKRTATPMQDRP